MLSFKRRKRRGPASTGEPAVPRRPGSALRRRDKLRNGWQSLSTQLLPWLSVLFLVVIVTVPLGLFIWFLFFTTIFSVQATTVLDAREHTIKEARQIVADQLVRVPFEQNIFFVQTDLLEGELLARLPQIRTVHVTRKLPGTIRVVIQEKEPMVLLLSGGRYFFIDESGVPYEEARLETLPGVVLPTVKNQDQESNVTLGVSAVAPEFVDFVQQVQEALPDLLGSQVAEIRIPSLAAREVHFLLDTNWELRFDVTRSPAGQLSILSRVVNEIITEEERPVLQYIDLRIKDRVYYRIRDGLLTPAESRP